MTTPAAPAFPRSLFVYSIFYGGMVCVAGVLANKQVALGPLGVEAGIFAFLMLVASSSAVAELFGRETANKLVLFGFIPLVFSILLAILVLALPAAHDMPADRLGAFNTVMGGTPRIWAAGIVAYGISQYLNVTIFSALRGKGEGRMIWLRAGIAAILSQVVDTLLFITISFYGEFPITDLLIGQMVAKIVLSAVLVPVLVQLFVSLGRRLDGTPR
ncbi:MAG TPA: queuosine precursor transporter [Allosphingosinicella sp.]|nr:queuosine precursor transporter [Allosphingosinicella sp.]